MVLAIVAGTFALTALLIAGMVFVFRQMGEQKLRAEFGDAPPPLRTASANCFGLQSRGRAQIRGSGALAFTGQKLWFRALVAGIELDIPVSAITAVELVDSHLGKRVFGKKLLKVHFDPGEPDAVAFALADPARWKSALEEARWGQGPAPAE